ncbi:MAG TPA: hypothetical protein VF820_06310 [Patescibacteria group bacterium]
MTTLHRVTEATRKVLIGFAIGIGSILFLIFFLRLLGTIKDTLFPTPPTPPTMSFGKLPSLTFPQSSISGSFTYALNTISGTLPTLPDRATIYPIQQPQANLLSFDDAQKVLAQNGFSGSAVTVSSEEYQWQQATSPFLKITYNIVNHNFSITSNYLADPTVLAAINLPSQIQATSLSKAFLTNISSYPSDIDESKTSVQLYDIQNSTLVSAISLSNAKILQVNYFQNNINNLPIVYPDTPNSTMQISVAAGTTQPQVVAADFYHQVVQTDKSATYPIKTAQQAYDDLKANKGYIASYNGSGNSITIKNVYLAYYLGKAQQQYAMPVIVFQGDNNFYAFVSAITDAPVGK